MICDISPYDMKWQDYIDTEMAWLRLDVMMMYAMPDP